jgi:hypothetical protein
MFPSQGGIREGFYRKKLSSATCRDRTLTLIRIPLPLEYLPTTTTGNLTCWLYKLSPSSSWHAPSVEGRLAEVELPAECRNTQAATLPGPKDPDPSLFSLDFALTWHVSLPRWYKGRVLQEKTFKGYMP